MPSPEIERHCLTHRFDSEENKKPNYWVRICLVVVLALFPTVLFFNFYPRISVAGWDLLDYALPDGVFVYIVIAYTLLFIPIWFWLRALYVDKFRILKVANSKDYQVTRADDLVDTFDLQNNLTNARIKVSIREVGYFSAAEYWRIKDLPTTGR